MEHFHENGSQLEAVNPFLPNAPFWSPWKHQKIFGFLMFPGGSKANIGEKMINCFREKSSIKLLPG